VYSLFYKCMSQTIRGGAAVTSTKRSHAPRAPPLLARSSRRADFPAPTVTDGAAPILAG